MKHIITLIISTIILSCPLFSADTAESVSFSLESVNADLNRIASVGVNCSAPSNLAAAVFELDYDKTALEFRGFESGGTVRYETGDKLKLIYFSSKNSEPEKEILRMKFLTAGDGDFDLNLSVAECFTQSGESVSVGSALNGTVNSFENNAKSNNSLAITSAVSSNSGYELRGKGAGVDDSDDLFDDDDVALSQTGELNDIGEKPFYPYFIIFLGIAAAVIIAVLTVFRIRMSAKKKKSQGYNSK